MSANHVDPLRLENARTIADENVAFGIFMLYPPPTLKLIAKNADVFAVRLSNFLSQVCAVILPVMGLFA